VLQYAECKKGEEMSKKVCLALLLAMIGGLVAAVAVYVSGSGGLPVAIATYSFVGAVLVVGILICVSKYK
jgi:hypothetical protein